MERITEEQYREAVANKDKAQETINQYFKQRSEDFKERMEKNPVFAPDELRFSATARCPCGSGLAYPKDCGMHHYWDCAAILMGTADQNIQHCPQYPFSFYDIKSESEHRGTTRPSVDTGPDNPTEGR